MNRMLAIMIGMLIIALLLVLCYAMLVVASQAEQDAEEMYRRWKERQDDD